MAQFQSLVYGHLAPNAELGLQKGLAEESCSNHGSQEVEKAGKAREKNIPSKGMLQ